MYQVSYLSSELINYRRASSASRILARCWPWELCTGRLLCTECTAPRQACTGSATVARGAARGAALDCRGAGIPPAIRRGSRARARMQVVLCVCVCGGSAGPPSISSALVLAAGALVGLSRTIGTTQCSPHLTVLAATTATVARPQTNASAVGRSYIG